MSFIVIQSWHIDTNLFPMLYKYNCSFSECDTLASVYFVRNELIHFGKVSDTDESLTEKKLPEMITYMTHKGVCTCLWQDFDYIVQCVM